MVLLGRSIVTEAELAKFADNKLQIGKSLPCSVFRKIRAFCGGTVHCGRMRSEHLLVQSMMTAYCEIAP